MCERQVSTDPLSQNRNSLQVFRVFSFAAIYLSIVANLYLFDLTSENLLRVYDVMEDQLKLVIEDC